MMVSLGWELKKKQVTVWNDIPNPFISGEFSYVQYASLHIGGFKQF